MSLNFTITKKQEEQNSTVRVVPTCIGTFKVHFSYAVIDPHDKMNLIPEAIKSCPFVVPEKRYSDPDKQREYHNAVQDINAVLLQNMLNEAAKFGTSSPVCYPELVFATKEVFV